MNAPAIPATSRYFLVFFRQNQNEACSQQVFVFFYIFRSVLRPKSLPADSRYFWKFYICSSELNHQSCR